MNVPLFIGNRLGPHELNVVFVFLAHVDDGIGLRPVFVGVDIVGFNGHIDDTSVACFIVQHQRDVPLLTLGASRLRCEVRLTEGHARVRTGGVPSDAAGKGAAIPAGRAINDPVGHKRYSGVSGVAKVQGCTALHVMDSILGRCAGISLWHFRVSGTSGDGDFKTSALNTEIVWVSSDIVFQEVAKEREGAAVGTLGMGRYVNGGDDEAAFLIAANSEDGVLDIFR